MKPYSNLVRLIVEILLIIAGAEAVIMWVLPSVAPVATGWTAPLINTAALLLLSGPLIYWRASLRWKAQFGAVAHSVDLGLARSKAMGLAIAAQVIGLLLTGTGVAWQRFNLDEAARTQFVNESDRIERDVIRRLNLGQSGLKGLRGTYAASSGVNRAEFRAFVESLDMKNEYQGLRGFGFIQRVPRAELESYVAGVRADEAPDFRVVVADTASDLWVVRFIEPVTVNWNAWGSDVGQDPVLSRALERAVDTGEATLSDKINLLDGGRSPGFFLFVPIYRVGTDPSTPAQRKAALVGVGFASIVATELFEGLGIAAQSKLDFEIFQGSELRADLQIFGTLGQSVTSARAPAKFASLRTLNIAGSTLSLRIQSNPTYENLQDRSSLTLIALLGAGSSFLIAWAVWLLASGHARAQLLAQSMTADLDRMARVVQHTNNAVMISDAQSRITWVNAGFSRLTGYTYDEALGKTPGELLSSGKATPQVLRVLELAVAMGEPCRVEILNRTKDGREYWADTELQPIRDSKGDLIGFMEIGTDITHQKTIQQRLETAMREANALLSTVEMHAIVSVSDRDGTITDVNAAFCESSGYAREELIGHSHRLVNAGHHPPEFWAEMWKTISSGHPWRGDICNRAKDGSLYWVDSMIAPFVGDDGKVDKYVSIRTNITARVLGQKRLLEMSDRMAVAIEGGNDGLWDWMDVGQDAQWWAPNFYALLGYGMGDMEASTTSYVALLHPDSVAVSNRAVRAALEQCLPLDMEVQLLTKERGYRWFRVCAKVFPDAQGQARRMAGSTQDVHERKLAQATVIQTSQRFALAADSAGIGVWEWDLQTRVLTWDAQMYHLYQRTPDIDTPPLSILMENLHPQDKARFEEALQQTIRNDAVFEGNYRILWPNGEVRHVRAAARSVRDSDGKAVRLTGVNFDITEVRRAQEALSESEAFLDRAGRMAGVGGWRVDLKTNRIYWSKETRHIHEVDDDFVPELDQVIQSYAPEARPVIEAAVQRCIATGEGWDLELPMLTAKGRTIWIRTVGEVELEDGKPVMLVGALQDITERKIREQELRLKDAELRQALKDAEQSAQEVSRSQVLLSSSIDALDDAFVLYDAEDRLVLCNQRYREFYPETAEMLQPGNRFEDIIRYGAEHGQYQEAIGQIEEWVHQRMTQHRMPHSRLQQRLRSGRIVRVVERRTEAGYTVGFRVDITDLVMATEAAEEASRSKSQFLANMSHEIRTPMNAILGMLKLLQNTELTARQSDYTNKTEAAARSLLGLLNDILDFSKVEAGKMTLDPRPFSPDRMLRDLSVILSANVGQKDIEVLFDIDPALPAMVVGDDMRLQQVLINLGGNAIKFTSAGEVVLRLRVLEQTPDAVLVEFAVQDSGIGIAPENQKHIFSGFSQAEANTTRRFGGTGLGLAISSRLTTLLGGTLQLQSALGEGSTFSFQLRLARYEELAPALASGLPPAAGLPVLVVDDNPMARDIMVHMGKSLGWQVDAVADGPQALAQVQKQAATGTSYRAIFVDWHMPGMDGWQTSHAIRTMDSASQKAGAPERPLIVMVTAHGRDMLSQRSADEQAMLDAFLVKPVTASMLRDAIAEAELAQRTAARGDNPMAPQAVVKPHRLQGLRILVVEDNKINQMVAHGLLSAEGAEVTLADDGALGVAAVVHAPTAFDVVLMDVQMPVMDGYTATRTLRARPELHNLPIIAMTANAMASDRAACLAAGMNDHVGKPFELDHLVATVLRYGGRPDTPQFPAHQPAASIPHVFTAGDLDLDGALMRLGGDVSMLMGIVQNFAEDLVHVPQRLKAELAAGLQQDAARTLHTLKGLASTVGARHLAQVAAQLEARSKAGISLPEHADCVAQLQAAVDASVGSLTQALAAHSGATEPAPAGPVLNGEALQSDLRALADLLAQDDMQALEAYAALRNVHAPALGPMLDALDQAMSGLEFEEALACCRALLAT